jgi:cardiolipin synthase
MREHPHILAESIVRNNGGAMADRRRSAPDDRSVLLGLRELADQALSRAAGAQLIGGNRVRLLRDARENYPAWLEAIRSARHYVNFESYIIHEDDTGREFADVLIARAEEGVRVRLIYDWMGGFGKASRRFWNRLRNGGVEVLCYNPPRLDSPIGWLSRDHRKMLSVDGEVGFITGLCVGQMWVGDPRRNIEPWRDTGVEIRGCAVLAIERAFSRIWTICGGETPSFADAAKPAGDTAVRIVASEPATSSMLRMDELVAALARKSLWLTDAYYAATSSYVQALRSAAKDGVDVRLLVPNGTDIPLLRPLSRAGYRTLLEGGIRIFEWNGTMLHAKTAVADGHWARVGSTNLNIASWFGNYELDAVIEDESFAAEMTQAYLEDLENATEVVLDRKAHVRAPGEPKHPLVASGGGSAGRAVAGAVRIGNAIGAAFTNRRVLEPVEARIATSGGILLAILATVFALYPLALAYPAAVVFAWLAIVCLYRAVGLKRLGRKRYVPHQDRAAERHSRSDVPRAQ